jgi:importin subunit beta-1
MSCFGDIALAISGDFEKYLKPVVQMLQEASGTRVQDGGGPSNEEWVDYLNSLREGVLEAYTGIIHGLRDANKLPLFKEHVNGVLHFVQLITEDPSVSESVMKAAVGVIGDLIFVFQTELTHHLGQAPFLVKLVDYAQRCQDESMRQTTAWLRSLIQKYGGS